MGAAPASLTLVALAGVPLVAAGDDLAGLILEALAASGQTLAAGDVLVLAQKIVSKAEGRLVDLRAVTPSARAHELAALTDKDPRIVELVLAESTEVIRARRGVLVVAHRLGLVLANAGIDQSNVAQGDGDEMALLLPVDPDGTAARLRAELAARTGVAPGVLIIDSIGRAWRQGTIGTALGAAGLPGLLDLRGRPDLYGRALRTSELGHADEVAAAASLVMGQADEGRPVVLVRGLPPAARDGRAAELIRPPQMDLFR
ncbi:MAG: coenzyme F420-0:L-glutamate ligase [Alphaproteobacteria bacterium]|nr:coenzyme F420-0:L-glutamate ligase [Alphaproteobacteria bacterium]